MSDPSNSQMAAQQHELTLTRHYENLLLARESSSMQEDLSNNTTIADSLQRLSESLHALLHSMAGEEPPNHQNEGVEEAERLLDSLLDNREDWATERESEIARLEQENEQLREMLGIDKATAKTQGWLEDEARELTYTPYVPTTMPQPSPHSTESSPGGQGSGRPTTSPFVNIPSFTVPSGMSVNLGPPPRAPDSMPGMRGTQGRRPAMFGQRGRGGGPSLWEAAGHAPAVPERPWQAQVGLDLS